MTTLETVDRDQELGSSGSSAGGASTSTYGKARAKAQNAYGSARNRASASVTTLKDRIEANPLIAVAGGLATGAILATVVPRSRREQELLSDVGHKVTDAAREAADTAVQAAHQQVDEIKQNALAKVGEAVLGAVSGEASRNG